MKNLFCLFTPGDNLNKLLTNHSEIILEGKKKFGNFYIISFSNLLKIKHNIKIDVENKKKYDEAGVEFFYPKTNKEFNEFVKNKNIYALDCLGVNYTYVWGIRRLVNKKNIFLILLIDSGHISNERIENNLLFKGKVYELKRFILRKLYRFLVLLKFFPPIFIYFECRKNIFHHFAKNKKFHFLEKIFPFFNIFNFKNVFLINSKSQINLTINKELIAEKKIIFIDGNYKNEEYFFRENLDIKKIENNYFKNLSKVLKKLETIFEKEVEICLHPSSNLELYKDYFNDTNIKISLGQTKKKVFEASIVLFHESSAIMEAIFLKKKIISLATDLLGLYHSNRVKFYQKELGLLSINIDDEEFNLSKSEINQKLISSVNSYDMFLSKINIDNNNEKSSDKVIRVLKSYIV